MTMLNFVRFYLVNEKDKRFPEGKRFLFSNSHSFPGGHSLVVRTGQPGRGFC